MNKFKQWKQAMKNTPPERLLKINMQGYVLQSLGIIIICSILIYTKTMWWLSFVFVFALWNNYSGFVSSYQQYNQIKELREELAIPQQEITSPHLKKTELIKNKFGKKPAWVSAIASAGLTYILIGDFSGGWLLKIGKVIFAFLVMLIAYYILYFILFYKLARRYKNG